MIAVRNIGSSCLFLCLGALVACGDGGAPSQPPGVPTPVPVVRAPQITTQPTLAALNEGESATLTVTADGTAPLSYQWQRNGTDVAGATNLTYAVPAALVSDDGASYTVTIGNSAGHVTSSAAVLHVTGASITQLIGASGGVVTLGSNGLKATITFPVGALSANTAITMQSLPPAAGETLRLSIHPAGIVFAQPVTAMIEYPIGRTPAAFATVGQSLGTDTAYLATTLDGNARTLTALLTTSGGATLKPQAQALKSKPSTTMQAHSISSVTMQDVPAEDTGGLVSVYANFTTDELIAHVR